MAYQKASADHRVSNKQLWLLSHLLIEAYGLRFPENAAEASTMIGKLKGTDQGEVLCPGCGEKSNAHTSDCTFAAFVARA